jgi:serine/threonine protein kinase
VTEKDPAADRLEQLVDQFDSLWQQGSGPKWTAWLEQAGPAEQTKLARLLVPIELEYRRQRGETIKPEQDYPEASTEQLALVRELLTPSLHEDATRAPNRAAAKVNSSKDLASQTFGPYKLLQKLGEGGMGEVWMAEQKEPVKRRVALKLIKTGLDNKQVIARFEAERQALAMMDHPNIARVLDAGTTPQGQPFFVMELVQGIPFNSYCDQNKLSIDQRLRLFIPVCQAIQHAHQKGIIHRDLKPSNVLVSLYDGQPVPKVIDFGLAKALQPTTHLTDKTMFTEFGQVVGTLQYMSPEQAEMNQLDVDTRSDIYSLGVMLYELLTGSTPIDQETMRRQAVLQVLHAIREQEPPRPSARLSSSTQEAVSGISSQRQIDPTKLKSILRGELDWIVMRALEKDRTRRYETASGFAEDIQRYLEGDPVLARPPSAGYRLSKYVRRNKGLVASLASIAALLIGGIIGTSWFAIEANRAKAEADRNAKAAENARAESERERARAVQREQEAIDAVRRFGDSVANNQDLKNRPELESLRKTLLKEPLAYFKSFAQQLQQDSDTSPESLARMAQAAFDLAFLTNEIGDKQDALDAYQRAREIRERLARDNPTMTEYQSDLAKSHNNIGLLLRETGQPAEALAALQRAHEIRERLVRENPTVNEYKSDLAASHNNIGLLLSRTGQPTEELAAYQRAREIRERLVRENPTVTMYQQRLAAGHNNIGHVLIQTGQLAEALAAHRQARENRERLVRENPTVTEYQSDLAASYISIGNLLSQTGQPAEGLAAYQRALLLQERLARENPTVTYYQRDLATCHKNIGALLSQTGQPLDALAAYQQAREIRERLVRDNPTVTEYQRDLAGSNNSIGNLLSQTGQPIDALAAYQQALLLQERLTRENPTVTKYQNDLAESRINIGLLLEETGQPAEALAAYQRAQEIQERLVRENPSFSEYHFALAKNRLNMGILLSQIGQPSEAMAAYQHVLEILERLVHDDPAVSEYQSVMGGALNCMAALDLKNQRFDEARQKLVKAIKFQQQALVGNPNQPVYRQNLGSHYANLAEAAEGLKDGALLLQARRGLAELARSPEGELNEDYAEALNSLIWELVKHSPDAASRSLLAEELTNLRRMVEKFPRGLYYNSLGTAEYRMGNYQAAIDACAKSLELLPKEQNLPGPHPGDLAILAMSHRQLGSAEEANKFRTQLDEAMKNESFKDDPECQSFAAEVAELFSKDEPSKPSAAATSGSPTDK